jgi:hypothetical protein
MILIGKIIFIMLTTVIMLFQVYFLFSLYSKNNQNNQNNQNENPTTIVDKQIIYTKPTISESIHHDRMVDPVKLYDYKKLKDPLEEPTNRPDRYLLGPLEYRKMFNLPTQGYPDTYRWMGILVSDDATDDKNKILKLFGRQKYPRSNEYQYYVMINMGHDQVKVHIEQKRELYDNDPVTINELGKTYKVKLNKDDEMEYNPYF